MSMIDESPFRGGWILPRKKIWCNKWSKKPSNNMLNNMGVEAKRGMGSHVYLYARRNTMETVCFCRNNNLALGKFWGEKNGPQNRNCTIKIHFIRINRIQDDDVNHKGKICKKKEGKRKNYFFLSYLWHISLSVHPNFDFGDSLDAELNSASNPYPHCILLSIRGNLGSKMGLIRKRAKISFCELEFKNQ